MEYEGATKLREQISVCDESHVQTILQDIMRKNPLPITLHMIARAIEWNEHESPLFSTRAIASIIRSLSGIN